MMRVGDLFASVIKILLVFILGELLYASAFLTVGLVVVAIWIFAVWYISGVYQKNQASGSGVII